MTTPESADAEEEAHGRPRMTRAARNASLAGAAVGLVVAVWIGLELASKPVRWQDVGFTIVSTTEATVTYDVYLYTEADAQCRVRALSENFAEVGVADVWIAREDGNRQRHTTSIATVAEATTAVVDVCFVP